MVFRIQSLQKRLFLFLLVPTCLLLAGVGFGGYLFARNIMLQSWQEAAILKLQRAAHHIDMRLGLPLEWIQLFNETGNVSDNFATSEWILDHLRGLPHAGRSAPGPLARDPPQDLRARGRRGPRQPAPRRTGAADPRPR